ncbi:TIR domain-containing protein [Puniceibacterium confluentis]|uniref:TIR domain-containing protein n=1 Tax=Puniceibacterium confluentis TaxID=1958944 RepID=UPI0011B7E311|nr:TIR domain-containing protein [Puniceibacterium confluentis]
MQPKIFQRFSGERGFDLAIDAIKNQKVTLGNVEAAQELCSRGQLTFFGKGEFLAQEGDWANSITFLVAGKAEVRIKGFKVAERQAGQHVGEMALIDPSQPRSASVVAVEPTVGLVVSEEAFTSVASNHPNMWRELAKEISDRLRQRKKFIRPTNPVPFMFVACASESLPVAMALQAYFEGREVVVEVWTDNVFKPSHGTMESLESKLETADFTVAIFSADDTVKSRGVERLAPRDNTVFELGLFAGAIGRERSFFAIQKHIDLKVPSDLAGITSLRFGPAQEPDDKPDVSEACSQIEERISVLGPR